MSEARVEVEIGPCSYCGEEQEMEPEHVVPRSIFVNDNQSTIIIPLATVATTRKAPARTIYETRW